MLGKKSPRPPPTVPETPPDTGTTKDAKKAPVADVWSELQRQLNEALDNWTRWAADMEERLSWLSPEATWRTCSGCSGTSWPWATVCATCGKTLHGDREAIK